MITPSSSDVTDFLNTGESWRPVNLLTLTLQSGTVLRLTDHDVDLPVAALGGTFSHQLLFKRSGATHKRGVEVDTITIDVMPSPADLIGAVPWLTAAQAGVLDYAQVRLDIGVITLANGGAFDQWSPLGLVGTFPWFVGDVGQVSDISAQHCVLSCKSFTARLDLQMPRNLIQPGCQKTVFTPSCGLVESAWRTTGVTSSIYNQGADFTMTGITQPDGYFDGGRLTVLSGDNANVVRRIKAQVGSHLYLFGPLIYPLVGGESVAISPGCAKTQAVCSAKFSNIVNFRGFPYVPTPETVL